MNYDLIEDGVKKILLGLDLELNDENLIHTPERYRRFLSEMFENKEPRWATFDEDYTDFVLLKGHHLFTLCPHHLLPVELCASVAYIPNGRVLGLSKLARALDELNQGPILQEKFTRDVLFRIKKICKGTTSCAVLVEGRHDCMRIRGVKSEASLLTYRCEGLFETDSIMQQRFFTLAKSG